MTRSYNDLEQEKPLRSDLSDSELAALVRESLGRLLPAIKPELAEVFRRVEFLGESCETVAAALEIHIETAEARLHMARKAMHSLLEHGARYHPDPSRQTEL